MPVGVSDLAKALNADGADETLGSAAELEYWPSLEGLAGAYE